jgi:hypothetical protein
LPVAVDASNKAGATFTPLNIRKVSPQRLADKLGTRAMLLL